MIWVIWSRRGCDPMPSCVTCFQWVGWAPILLTSCRWAQGKDCVPLLKTFCPALSCGHALLSTGQVVGPASFQCDRQFLVRTPAAWAQCDHCFSDWACSGHSHHIFFSLHLSLCFFFFYFFPLHAFHVWWNKCLSCSSGFAGMNLMCACFLPTCILKCACWATLPWEEAWVRVKAGDLGFDPWSSRPCCVASGKPLRLLGHPGSSFVIWGSFGVLGMMACHVL